MAAAEDRLWYRKPAGQWEEALPLGNGRLGAMIFGETDKEHIQVNEESMWYGGRVDRNNPDMKENLPKIRMLLEEGRIREAEELLLLAGSGRPCKMHPYQTLGDITIVYPDQGEAQDYLRSLDLKKAFAEVSYRAGEAAYKKEYFISRPAGALILRLSTTRPEGISLQADLSRGNFFDALDSFQDGIFLSGNQGRGGIEFTAMLRAKASGGRVYTVGEYLKAEGAKEVILYFTADTTYHMTPQERDACIDRFCRHRTLPDEPEYQDLSNWERQEYLHQQALQSALKEKLFQRIDACMNKTWEELLKEHLEDYGSFFDRVELSLEEKEDRTQLPTDERLLSPCGDNGLMKLLFDFGRYLLICSSRPGDLPATLQGIWNKDFTPSWASKYTVNINLEMNYWPAEICNLSECHTVLLGLLEKMRPNGRKTARQMYGCRGFLCHHNTNINGETAPQDHWKPGSYWVMGAAWLCTHLWTHYQYTLDRKFLRQAFPIMAEAALFFVDFMIEKDGYLVTSPSVSPENTYILPGGERGSCCIGPTMDNQILRHFFTGVTEAGRVLGEEAEEIRVEGIEDMQAFLNQIEEMKGRLMPTRIGSNGAIMEWMEEYEEAQPGHRHISHLYGLYPSDEITVDGTPLLAAAARTTLERRLANGGGHTGWSRAWIINHYAKLWDGEKAYENLEKMLESSTYPNLFDKHPPFQIDGNFGAAAAIAQMLVQGSDKRVVLLPALPKEWKNGSVKGLRLPGNAGIDIVWKDGNLETVVITAYSDYRTRVKYREESAELILKAGESKVFTGHLPQ